MSVRSKWPKEAHERFATLVASELWDIFSTQEKRASQSKVGGRFGVPGSTVQGWLDGSIPDTPTLREIALLLGWQLDDLVIYLQHGTRPGKNYIDRIKHDMEYLAPSEIYEIAQTAIQFLAPKLR